jgi:hypothetical protein
MSLTNNIHPQVRIFVTMLCEGFNVPNSETKMQAFGEKLKNPHTPALREAYNIFTDGRGQSNKMPTIAEVMEVYKSVVKRMTMQSEQKLVNNHPREVDYENSKKMFNKLTKMVRDGISHVKHPIDSDTIDWQHGYKFTLSRDEKGQDWVKYHDHPANIQ